MQIVLLILITVCLAVLVNVRANMPLRAAIRHKILFNDALGIYLLKVRSNGNNHYFMLDTGANLSVMDSGYVTGENFMLEPVEGEGSFTSWNNETTKTTYAKGAFSVDGQVYADGFQVVDCGEQFSEKRWGIRLSGVLGMSFLNQFHMDLKDGYLYKDEI